jgi:hypothetical protein
MSANIIDISMSKKKRNINGYSKPQCRNKGGELVNRHHHIINASKEVKWKNGALTSYNNKHGMEPE